jgi:hypothetical protein
MIDRDGKEGTIPLKTDFFKDTAVQKKLASFDDLSWSSVTKLHASRQAAQAGRSSPSQSPALSHAQTPAPAAAAKAAINRILHVRVNDLAHPIGSDSVLRAVTANFARAGIAVNVTYGSFSEDEFKGRRDNIQITILSSQVDAADEQLIRDTYASQGWKRQEDINQHLTSITAKLRATAAGISSGTQDSSGTPVDPLANLIFIKQIDTADQAALGQVFSAMNPNHPDAAAEAQNIYMYSDTITHEIGHNLGLGHSADTANYMFSPPNNGPTPDRLTHDILGKPEATRLKNNRQAWAQWMREELARTEPSFSQAQIDAMRATLQKFLPP